MEPRGLPRAMGRLPHALGTDLKESLQAGDFASLILLEIVSQSSANFCNAGQFNIADQFKTFCTNRGWLTFGLNWSRQGIITKQSSARFNNDDLILALAAGSERAQGDWIVLGAGLTCAAEDYHSNSETTELLWQTTADLLILALQRGKEGVLWLEQEDTRDLQILGHRLEFYRRLARINSTTARQLEIESRIDFLTGIANRRGFEDAFRRMADAARRRQRALALIYIDGDSLKKLNDCSGHDAGDCFIIAISRVLVAVVRASDLIARWGADEFAVVMEETALDKVRALANRIRLAVETRTEGTVSIGVYCGIPNNLEDVINNADRALYRAKQGGKNRVELA